MSRGVTCPCGAWSAGGYFVWRGRPSAICEDCARRHEERLEMQQPRVASAAALCESIRAAVLTAGAAAPRHDSIADAVIEALGPNPLEVPC